MKNIQLFDVDGTLTHHEMDMAKWQPTEFTTFSYWPLISSYFSRDTHKLSRAITAWEKSLVDVRSTDEASLQFLEVVIKQHFRENITADDVIAYATGITNTFIKHNVIHLEAIAYINECLQAGTICILTTGSYLDGLKGFISALTQHKLLHPTDNLILHGAEVDWKKRSVIRANVGQYKVDKLPPFLRSIGSPYAIKAVFGDDPVINDKQLFSLVPHENAFVIKSHKNKHLSFSYHHCSWHEYLHNHKNRILAS